ncbi:protease [Paenibacillus hunanensis]|uniref:protease n=1 Tax=Paenibacillus hunanensis TaxID=539262 RepID=UPI002A69E89E|nr:protease [Paenibacillus hunanensis]WPP42579.1 protease [Paenibacillus hunanensis]
METLYWTCLIIGAVYALFSLVFGDWLGDVLGGLELPGVDFLKPIVLAGTVTVFGGAGIILDKYTTLSTSLVLVLSLAAGILGALLVFFAYIKPMEHSEVSTGYSIRELVGKIGEITIPVPETGYGEVMVRLSGGNVVHIASSFDHCSIAAGSRVVIIEEQEGILAVAEFEKQDALSSLSHSSLR